MITVYKIISFIHFLNIVFVKLQFTLIKTIHSWNQIKTKINAIDEILVTNISFLPLVYIYKRCKLKKIIVCNWIKCLETFHTLNI